MRRSGRTVALAAALLSIVTGAAPAFAVAKAQAYQNQSKVEAAQWTVVIAMGTMPVYTAQPPLTYNSLLTPQYAVLTNFGNVKPGTLELRFTAALGLITNVQACTTQWANPGLAATCPGTMRTIAVNSVQTDQTQIPGPGETWWIQIGTVATTGAQLTAAATKPVSSGTVFNS